MTALVKTAVPRVKWARSAKDARSDEAVWLTASGRVAPNWLISWLPYAQAGWILASTAAIVGIVVVAFTPLNALIWLPLAAWSNWELVLLRRYARGVAFALHGRFDEADAVLRPLARSRVFGYRIRGFAGAYLAQVERARGRRREALATIRKAHPQLSANGERGESAMVLAKLMETELLIDLDQVDEAARVFNLRQGVEPKGEYVRVAYWTTQLYLWMAEGRAVPDRGTLDARTKTVIDYRSGAPILGLLAWAYQQSGDDARARELLELARTREARIPIEVAYPRLHAWMEAQG